MPLLVLLLVLGVGAAEIWAIIEVAGLIGIGLTLLALVATSCVGGWLVRREGARAWRSFTVAVSSGRPPGRELTDGALIVAGGILMVVPGFLTAAVGLLCLLRPTRAPLRWALTGLAIRRASRVAPVRPAPEPAHVVIDGEIERP